MTEKHFIERQFDGKILFFILSKTVERQLLLRLLLSLRKAQQVLWTQLTAGR